jgi:aminoglycoside N3'-acetyltransferase
VIKISAETKIVYFQIIDGTQENVEELTKALIELKKKLSYDIEFLVGNEKVQLVDVRFLLKELLKLYKMEKKLREAKK